MVFTSVEMHGLFTNNDMGTLFRKLREDSINFSAPGSRRKSLAISLRNEAGEMLIHRAAKRGNVEYIDEILRAGEPRDINAVVLLDKKTKTPIHYAIQSGNPNAVKYMLEKGANIWDLPGGLEGLKRYVMPQHQEMKEYLSSDEFIESLTRSTNKLQPIQAVGQGVYEKRNQASSHSLKTPQQMRFEDFFKPKVALPVIALDENEMPRSSSSSTGALSVARSVSRSESLTSTESLSDEERQGKKRNYSSLTEGSSSPVRQTIRRDPLSPAENRLNSGRFISAREMLTGSSWAERNPSKASRQTAWTQAINKDGAQDIIGRR